MKLIDLKEAGVHYQPETNDKAELKARLDDLRRELADMLQLGEDEREAETIADIEAEIQSVKDLMI